MTSQAVIFDLTDTADERFDRPIEAMLVALLAFMPLALGAVQPWSELVVVAAAALMSLALAAKLLVRADVRLVRTWAYAPVIAFVALVVLQLVPLPAWLLRLISPNTVALRAELMQGMPEDARYDLRFVTPSFYPEATLGHLRMLLAIVAIFVVTLNVVRRLEQVKRLLAAIAVIGAVVAMVALAQNVTDAQRIYWIVPIESNQATSGPFVNHSHGAQFFNLSLGAALGLLLMHLDQLPRRRVDERTSRAAVALAQPVTRPIWMLACAVVAMAVCVPLSLSRGGMIALLVAAIFTTLVLATRRGMGGRTWIFVGIVLAAAAVLLAFRFDEVLSRATSAGDPESLGGRIDILRGSRDLWRKFPVFGTGLGTFAVMFPMFDPSSIVKVAEHAENEYAQLLVETGAIGALAMLAFLLVIAVVYVRSVRGAPSPMASGAMGLGFGIVAILVHSAADFGQHVPAVAALTAVSCALMINLAHATRRREEPPGYEPPAVRVPRRWRVAGATVGLAAAAFVVFGAVQILRASNRFAAARDVERRLQAASWQGADRDFAELLVPAQAAAAISPRDVAYRYELNRYRWRALSRSAPLDDRDLADARRVAGELLVGARLCPTYAPPYLLAGQVLHDVVHDSNGESLVRTGLRLAPTNPDANIAVAVLDARAGRWADAAERLRRTMEMSADHRQEVIDVVLGEFNRPQVALELAGKDRALLARVARTLDASADHADVAAEARARAERALLDEAAQPHATAATLAEAAQLALRTGDRATAIQFLRRATTIDYSALDLRLELARLFVEEGQPEQALREARNVLQQSPSNAAAKAMVAELQKPATRPVPTTLPTQPSTAPGTAPATQAGFKMT